MLPIIHFVLGGGMTEAQYEALAQQVQSYYTAHITSVQFNMIMYRWTDDVYSLIKTNQPTGPLLLCGHSYGGDKVIQVAAQFAVDGRVVNHLVAFDPVDNNGDNYSRPCAGFALTNNVAEAVAFYRGATEAPYSGQIISGPNFKNVLFPAVGGGDASHHGDSVWDSSCYNYVSIAVSGNNFLPTTVNPPTPVPIPPPPTPTPNPPSSVPNGPWGLTAKAVSSSEIDLVWDYHNSDPLADNMIVQVNSNGTWTTIATLDPTVIIFNHTGLTASTEYSYRIFAVNVKGDSGTSGPVNATTLAGSSPTKVVANTQLIVANNVVTGAVITYTDNTSNTFQKVS